jgi:anti-anti-sigma regulatory factor
MLRISVSNGSDTTRFKLEGKLAHEWVREAQVAWTAHMALNSNKELVVDLYDVCFVDDAGRQLLVEMHAAGAKLMGSGPMMSVLIDEINEGDEDLYECGEDERHIQEFES